MALVAVPSGGVGAVAGKTHCVGLWAGTGGQGIKEGYQQSEGFPKSFPQFGDFPEWERGIHRGRRVTGRLL